MKHDFDTWLNKYNLLMVNLANLHPLFLEPSPLSLESRVPLWLVLDGITFALSPICFKLHYGFV